MLKQNRMDLPLDLNKKLNIAHINLSTEAEGPYTRMAIWFQGCNILCEGCCNPELQPIKKAHIMTVQEVLEVALESQAQNGIEGVTLLGGEPTLQEGLISLVYILKDNNLGTILFTGKRIDVINGILLKGVDLVVDGHFDNDQIDTERNLIGSKNQNIYFITDRYKKNEDWFYALREKRVEINMGQVNDALITGDVI